MLELKYINLFLGLQKAREFRRKIWSKGLKYANIEYNVESYCFTAIIVSVVVK